MRVETSRQVQGIVRAMERERWIRRGWRRDALTALRVLWIVAWVALLCRLCVWLGGRVAGAW